MDTLNRAVRWYQAKIGTHDSPSWEPSVEDRVLRSIHDIPKKAATFKSQLIDVDLVDGSTFFKAKQSHAWPAHAWKGLVRLVCMPAYFAWWRQHTSLWFALSLLVMYICQLTAVGVVFSAGGSGHRGGAAAPAGGPSAWEVVNPLLLMIVLSIVHTQVVFTQSSHHSYTSKKARLLEKKKRRQKAAAVASAATIGLAGGGSGAGAGSSGGPAASAVKDKRRRTATTTALLAASRGSSGLEAAAAAAAASASNARSQLLLSSSTAGATAAATAVHGYMAVGGGGFGGSAPSISCTATTATSCNLSTDSSDESYTERTNYGPLSSASSAAAAAAVVAAATPAAPITVATLSPAEASAGVRFPLNSDGSCGGILCPLPSQLLLLDENAAAPLPPADCSNSSGTTAAPPAEADYRLPSSLLAISRDEAAAHAQLRADLQRIVGASPQLPLQQQQPPTAKLGLPVTATTGPKEEPDHCGAQLRRHRQPREPPVVVAASTVGLPLSLPGGGGSGSVVAAAARSPLDSLRVLPESTATSDVDTPSPSLLLKMRHTSASEWESNRMHSSDVNSTDSSSECSVDVESSAKWGDAPGGTTEDAVSVAGISLGGGGAGSAGGAAGSSGLSGAPIVRRRRRRVMQPPTAVSAAVAAAAGGVTELPPSAAAAVVYIPSAYDRISCIVWEEDACKKADLSVIDIGVIIEEKVEQIRPSYDYVLLAVLFVLLFSVTPFMFRVYHSPAAAAALVAAAGDWTAVTLAAGNWTERALRLGALADGLLSCDGAGVCFVLANGAVQRVYLSALVMFLLAVAERTYWQRLLYAKHFSYLTSSRRSRKYDVPHFRLNKVKNIKTWLSLRSFLKRRGPQRSVDVIVSATFVLLVCLLALMCVQLLRDHEAFLSVFANWELTVLCLILSVFLLRYYGLGTKINKKYRNLSILITEEINLYLQMEQKPHKKEDLMVANAVLKLAVDLIKEVESPFKMSNFNVNPVVFSVTKLIMLSAFSAVLTELFGFKLKLHKVKL